METARPNIELQPTRCAICGTHRNATQLYAANFAPEAFTPSVFSARRTPDRIHYRIVRCNSCGLVRSDPVAPAALLGQLYEQSHFTYSSETEDLRYTYGRQIASLAQFGVCRGGLLEIGCGNGFLLQEALRLGFREVKGVEPSREAVSHAPAEVRGEISCDILKPGMFQAQTFDVICLMQVLDHFADPVGVLTECHTLLRAGGLVLALNHNVEAFSARLMGERSPIVDIEHTYLYSPRTMRHLFQKCGFEVLAVNPVWNRFPLRYLMQLAPLPRSPKARLLRLLESTGIGRLKLNLPLGNLRLVGRKAQRA